MRADQQADEDEADDRRYPEPREDRDHDPRRPEDHQRVGQGGRMEIGGHGGEGRGGGPACHLGRGDTKKFIVIKYFRAKYLGQA